MKIGSGTSVKLTGFSFVFLVIAIALVWIVSSNSLFFTRQLNNIEDRVFPKLGIFEQTSLTD